MTLEELNQQEFQLINEMQQLTGTMEEMTSRINELKIPEKYKEIYKAYSNLNNVEGLKRAIFIQWYASVEPISYTGIGELDDELRTKNFVALNTLVAENKLDQEFSIMISHYYKVTSWFFESFSVNNELLNYLRKTNGSNTNINSIQLMSNRGQMGEYWNSLNRDNLYKENPPKAGPR